MGIRTHGAVVHRPGGPFTFEELEVDSPRPDELIVRVVACGVCHTDVAARDGLFSMSFPAVFGHEGAGVVELTGSAVTRVRPGDKVVLSFGSCGHCAHCREGQPSRCDSFDELNFGSARPDGSPTIRDTQGAPVGGFFFSQSSFARHALTRERNVIPVDAADEEELASFAPLGCGIQAGAGTVLNELEPRPGESLAVFGCGTVGLSALMAARLAGASPIIAVDTVEARLDLAKELGATLTIDGKQGKISSMILEAAGPVDYAVETTGRSRVIDQAMRSLGPAGKASLLAVSEDWDIAPKAPGPRQGVIYSVAGDSNPQVFIPFLIRSSREGKFPFRRLIREYPAERINEAVSDSLAGITIKPVLRF